MADSILCCVTKIKEDVTANAVCLDEIKVLMAALDVGVIAALCDKIDAQDVVLAELTDCVDEIKLGLFDPCPLPLVQPLTSTTAVVAGDQCADNPVGNEFEVTDDAGALIGTADIAGCTYNTVSDETTFTLTNNTVAPVELATASAVKGKAKVTAPTEGRIAVVGIDAAAGRMTLAEPLEAPLDLNQTLELFDASEAKVGEAVVTTAATAGATKVAVSTRVVQTALDTVVSLSKKA